MTSETARRLELVGAHGNKLVADHWGDSGADCVVFLNGGGQTRHAWGGTAAHVAKCGWQAVAVDLRGHGESDWTPDYVYRDFAADVISLAGQLPPRAVFVGASLGGISVIFAQDAFSREHPGQSLCRAMVLVDIAPRANPAGVERIMTFMRSGMAGFDTLEAAAEAVADYTRERKRPRGIDGLRKNLRQLEDGRWYWHWDPRFLDVSRNPANRPIGLLEQAASTIKVPTLLVRGSKSDVLTEDGVDAFRRVVPHAEFVDVAGAGHNLSDVFGLLAAWGAATLAKKAPTARFTYGLRSSSILAALSNAVMLLVAVGAIAWEAVQRFGHPEPVTGQTVMLIAGIGIVINGITAWLFRSGHDDINIRGAYLHMAADAAVSLGVVVAGLAIVMTGWMWVDPVTSLVISGIIVWGTWSLLRDSVNLALHAVPSGIDPAKVRAFLEGRPGVKKLHDLHIWPMSTTETALTCHLVMPGGHPGDAFLGQTVGELQRQFKISHVTLQIELDDAAACAFEPDHLV